MKVKYAVDQFYPHIVIAIITQCYACCFLFIQIKSCRMFKILFQFVYQNELVSSPLAEHPMIQDLAILFAFRCRCSIVYYPVRQLVRIYQSVRSLPALNLTVD